jgi:phage tail sheath protein FI
MTTNVSPGVYSSEIDLSLYLPQLSSAILGTANTFTKGPVNKRTLITSPDQLTTTFGGPNPNSQGYYALREFLRKGNQIWAVRVAHAATLATASVDAVDGSAANTLVFSPINPGSGWNGYQVILTSGTSTGRKISVVDPNGILLETFDNILKANAEANINGISKYITVVNITSGAPGEPVNQTLTLSGGNDGITGLTDGDVIGSSASGAQTGLELLRDTDAVDINIVHATGFASTAINQELIDIAQSRSDTLGIIDPPLGLSVQDVVNWHNGLSPGDFAYNSSYAALYWSWQTIQDTVNSLQVELAPSAFAAEIMAYTDAVTQPWFAPAGLNRGILTASLGSEISPNQGDRDLLYSPGNNVNPIVDFTAEGSTIWGQKTLQRAPTSLDRVNVRRMLLTLEKQVATVCKFLVFEQNDPVMWRKFTGLVQPVLNTMIAGQGLNQGLAVMNSQTNTPDVVGQNRAAGKIYLEPTLTAEQIELSFVVTPQGTSFQELIASGS